MRSRLKFENLPLVKSLAQPASFCRRFRVVTWNMLAPSYARQKSFPDVPGPCLQTAVRYPLIEAVLLALNPDVLCLQEVEEATRWQKWLSSQGLDSTFAAREARCDGCLIAWRRSLFKNAGELTVHFDPARVEIPVPEMVASRFTRYNNALIVKLAPADGHSGPRWIIATTHLYWGAQHEDVRCWQLKVLLERVEERFGVELPLAVCGDLNLLPGSCSHTFLARGSVEFQRAYRRVSRFLVDRDISKQARLLRHLGLDAAVETKLERDARRADGGTDMGQVPLFQRAIREGRVIVSSSGKMLQRHECPPSYYLDARNAKNSLAKLCCDLAVEVEPSRFFSRCVKCNGQILQCYPSSPEHARARESFHAPTDVTLYECQDCAQVYWFSVDADHPSARAQQQVRELLRFIEAEVRETATTFHGSPMASSTFLRDGGGSLEHSRALRSVYEDVEKGWITSDAASGEAVDVAPGAVSPPRVITNSKFGFHGCIDYMFLSPDLYAGCGRRLALPTVGSREPPSLVSKDWPSDHWPLAVDLDF